MRVLVPLIFGITGCAILIGLGVWQVQRLAWKEDMLARIEAQIGGAPVPLDQAALDEFQPVSARGTFTGDELHVLTSIKRIGAVYRVVAAFETQDGRRIMVDRGFIPTTAKDADRPAEAAEIIANFRTVAETDRFTPEPDLTANIWFARDVPAMAEALGAEPILLILRETSETDPPVTPFPVDTSGIPNDHLNYAITWFSLAAVWAAMTGYFLLRGRRRDT